MAVLAVLRRVRMLLLCVFWRPANTLYKEWSLLAYSQKLNQPSSSPSPWAGVWIGTLMSAPFPRTFQYWTATHNISCYIKLISRNSHIPLLYRILEGYSISFKSPLHPATSPSVRISHGQTLLVLPDVSQGHLEKELSIEFNQFNSDLAKRFLPHQRSQRWAWWSSWWISSLVSSPQ